MKIKNKGGIIRRMKETKRMWQLVRYINNNQHLLADWDYKEKMTFANTGKPVPDYLTKISQISLQRRSVRISRVIIATLFSINIQRKESSYPKNKKLTDKELEEVQNELGVLIADAQSRIEDCIESGYLEKDKSDNSLVYLPLMGKRFAGHFGLWKAWGGDLTEFILEWKVVVLVLVVIVRWNWVKIVTNKVLETIGL